MDSGEQPKSQPKDFDLHHCRWEELRKVMGLSAEQFTSFRSVVEGTALRMLPYITKGHSKSEDWEAFIETVDTFLPNIGKYAGNWHVVACFSILRRNGTFQRKWKEKQSGKVTQTDSSSVFKRKIQYIGRPIVARRKILSSSGFVGSSSIEMVNLVGGNLSSTEIQATEITPSLSPFPMNYPSPCTVCGFHPPIYPSHTRNLRKFLAHAEDLIPTLTYLGILHDRHLCMILNWPPVVRHAFVNSVNAERIRSDKQRLIKLFTGRPYTDHSPLAHKNQRQRMFDRIPKPPLEVASRIESGQAPLSELMQAMALQNENEFDEILQTIDSIWEEDPTPVPDRIADDTFWVVLFHKVYEKWHVMRFYEESGSEENNWAIKLYLTRKLTLNDPTNMSRQDRPLHPRVMSTRPKIAHPVIDSLTRSLQSNTLPYPGITLSICPVHHPPDYRLVGPRLHQILESHGAEELLPVFITAGIKTDQAVNTLSYSPKQDRIKLFSTVGIHLTDLQSFALNQILSKL